MKISEAMRRGSKMARQAFGSWSGGPGSGCALMLAAIGAGFRKQENPTLGTSHGSSGLPAELMNSYPFLVKKVQPVCACKVAADLSAWEMVMHINDEHHWTAERIAGWIEAHIETPTYSMLDVQHYIGEPLEMAEVPRV